jgi:hypothetical protein
MCKIEVLDLSPDGSELIPSFSMKYFREMGSNEATTPVPSTRKRTVDRQVKSNPRNKLIHGRHRCGKGRNGRGIITARHRGEVISAYTVKLIFDEIKKTYLVES